MKLPDHIERAVRAFQRLQGVGRKTAERYVFDILSCWESGAVQNLCDALQQISGSARERCNSCRVPLPSESLCPFCSEEREETRLIAIVTSLKDLYSIESLDLFDGTYFLLDSSLSPIDRRGIPEEVLEQLYEEICRKQVNELFLAFDSSPEGEATSFYISDAIRKKSLQDGAFCAPKVTAFATGVPMGATLDFLDRSTLGKAFLHRVVVA